jgi:CspA family cold shock protein
MSARLLGVVAWFDRLKGYGFITPAGSDRDVFCHYTAIVGEGYRNLEQGQTVEFELGVRQGKAIAQSVRPIAEVGADEQQQ